MAGNKAAWAEMKRYNIHDVLSTEELYDKLKAWVPQTGPNIYQLKDMTVKCRVCGDATRMRRKGVEMSRRGPLQKYQCQNCGSWTQGKKSV
jgi:transposase-like protein